MVDVTLERGDGHSRCPYAPYLRVIREDVETNPLLNKEKRRCVLEVFVIGSAKLKLGLAA